MLPNLDTAASQQQCHLVAGLEDLVEYADDLTNFLVTLGLKKAGLRRSPAEPSDTVG
jgi:hypothetical protein